jgi:hypothetical protein
LQALQAEDGAAEPAAAEPNGVVHV